MTIVSPAEIANRLLRDGHVAMSNGTVYIYAGPLGGWTPIDSGLATKHISFSSGSSASVNTAIAAEPVKQILLNGPIPRVKFPMSVCLATGRHGMEVRSSVPGDPGYDSDAEGDVTVALTEEPLSVLCESSASVSYDPSMSVCPLIGVEVPLMMGIDCIELGAFPSVSNVMQDLTLVLLWHIGNCIVDPKQLSHMVCIVGPSRTGKSTTLSAISDALGPNICKVIPEEVVTGPSSIGGDVLREINSGRLMMSTEVMQNTERKANGTPKPRILTSVKC